MEHVLFWEIPDLCKWAEQSWQQSCHVLVSSFSTAAAVIQLRLKDLLLLRVHDKFGCGHNWLSSHWSYLTGIESCTPDEYSDMSVVGYLHSMRDACWTTWPPERDTLRAHPGSGIMFSGHPKLLQVHREEYTCIPIKHAQCRIKNMDIKIPSTDISVSNELTYRSAAPKNVDPNSQKTCVCLNSHN